MAIDPRDPGGESPIDALKRDAHWTLILTSIGAGITITALGHLAEWNALSLAIHGVAGLLGGYLFGSGLARVATGLRFRPRARAFETVSFGSRLASSGLRVVSGTAVFALSYLYGFGAEHGLSGAAPHLVIPVFAWTVALLVVLYRAARALRPAIIVRRDHVAGQRGLASPVSNRPGLLHE